MDWSPCAIVSPLLLLVSWPTILNLRMMRKKPKSIFTGFIKRAEVYLFYLQVALPTANAPDKGYCEDSQTFAWKTIRELKSMLIEFRFHTWNVLSFSPTNNSSNPCQPFLFLISCNNSFAVNFKKIALYIFKTAFILNAPDDVKMIRHDHKCGYLNMTDLHLILKCLDTYIFSLIRIEQTKPIITNCSEELNVMTL